LLRQGVEHHEGLLCERGREHLSARNRPPENLIEAPFETRLMLVGNEADDRSCDVLAFLARTREARAVAVSSWAGARGMPGTAGPGQAVWTLAGSATREVASGVSGAT
jgi:hypothetical protein